MNDVVPAISVRGLVKRFKGLTAVDGLDLDVSSGRCLALLGPNGAGKSTTVNVLVGLLRPDAGEVRILGRDLRGRERRQTLEEIGVQLQETLLFDKLTCREIVVLFGSFYREPRNPDEVLELVGLQEKRDTRRGKLSGGQQQRLALGCALVNRPRLLFLDEPTTGLDPQARRRVWEIVHRFKKNGGTVLLTTHYMEEAELLADDVIVIDDGRCIARGSPAELIRTLDSQNRIELTFDNADVDVPEDALRTIAGVSQLRRDGNRIELHVRSIHLTVPAVLETLRQNARTLDDLHTRRATLEDVFVELTGKHLRDG
ncbi:MAG: ABC transporter ATP-binding protein [Acidobacteriota bacterium]|nr:ABC transporter ATP-binding protein [Acidobacteriota bacterium]